jgi:predicted transcriptional regulator
MKLPLKIINSDIIKIITSKLEYHKTITDILKEKKLNSTHTNLGNNVRTEWQSEIYTTRWSRNLWEKILNEWGTKFETYGKSDTGSLATIQNIYKIRESKLNHLIKIIYHTVRDAKRTSTPRGTAHTDQDARSVANHTMHSTKDTTSNMPTLWGIVSG